MRIIKSFKMFENKTISLQDSIDFFTKNGFDIMNLSNDCIFVYNQNENRHKGRVYSVSRYFQRVMLDELTGLYYKIINKVNYNGCLISDKDIDFSEMEKKIL